jgi:hypothetical protein
MNLSNSLFNQASERAAQASQGLQDRLGGLGANAMSSGCDTALRDEMERVNQQIEEVKTRVGAFEDKVNALNLNSLLTQVGAAAESAGRAAGSNLAERATGLANGAANAGISYARGYGDRIISKLNLALSLIHNAEDAVAAGAMALLLIRIRTKMNEFEDVMGELHASFAKVRAGVRVAEEAFGVVSTGIPASTLLEAASYVRNAERHMGIIEASLEEGAGVKRRSVERVSISTSEAIKSLSGGEDLLARILGESVASRMVNNPASFFNGPDPWAEISNALGSQWRLIEDASKSAKAIPDLIKRAASAYGDAKRWTKFGLLMPRTIDFLKGTAGEASLKNDVKNLRSKLAEVAARLEEGKSENTTRAWASLQLNIVRSQLIFLEGVATRELDERQQEWYDTAHAVFTHKFWGNEGLSLVEDVELWSQVTSSQAEQSGNIDSNVQGWALLGQKAISKVSAETASLRTLLNEASSMSTTSVGGAWSLVETLLKDVGLKDPLDTFVSGELPSEIDRIVDIAAGIVSGIQNSPIFEGGPLPCMDKIPAVPKLLDRAEVTFRDAARRSAIENATTFDAIADAAKVWVGTQYGIGEGIQSLQ